MRQAGFTHEENSYATPVEWYTPPSIFKALRLQFDLDPASPGAAVVPWIPAAKHLTIIEDGLKTPWEGKCWCNPPYGPMTRQWVARFIEHRNGMMLLFSRTDTEWFQTLALYADAICFIKGRVKFIPSRPQQGNGGAGAGSVLVAMGGECAEALKSCGLGYTVTKGDSQC